MLWAYVSELNKEIRTERFRVMESLMMVIFVLLKDGFFKEGEHVECVVNVGLILRETYTMIFQRSIPPFRIMILTFLYLIYLKRTNVMIL